MLWLFIEYTVLKIRTLGTIVFNAAVCIYKDYYKQSLNNQTSFCVLSPIQKASLLEYFLDLR